MQGSLTIRLDRFLLEPLESFRRDRIKLDVFQILISFGKRFRALAAQH